jgi:hypothetical protein
MAPQRQNLRTLERVPPTPDLIDPREAMGANL